MELLFKIVVLVNILFLLHKTYRLTEDLDTERAINIYLEERVRELLNGNKTRK